MGIHMKECNLNLLSLNNTSLGVHISILQKYCRLGKPVIYIFFILIKVTLI